MVTAAQQDALTRVGPGTPMGTLLRRYWMPVGASSELAPGGVKAVRLLGEDFALYRAETGEPALLDARCPHRGASLVHGIVEGASLRCAYHGWRFAPDGACVELPTLAPDEAVRARACTRGHRVAELGGLVFAYLGPEPAPLLPRYDVFVWPGLRDIGRAEIPCNWLQIMENSVDPVHLEWLHGRHLASVRSAHGLPPPTRYGRRHEKIGFDRFAHGIVKRRVLAGGSRADDDWSVGHPLVFPLMVRVGAQRQHRFQIRVPMDDTHTLHLWYSCYRPRDGEPAPQQDAIPVYEVPFRDPHGGPLLDFVDGGDIMAWTSQGPIADRTRELLVDTDRGVALLRRLLFEQMERVRAGDDPLGIVRDPATNAIIELPQEHAKYGDDDRFLAESLAMSHVRYSPIRREILAFLGLPDLA